MRKTADVNGEKRAKSQSGPARSEQTNAGTPDLLHAMQALYQLSYSPVNGYVIGLQLSPRIAN
jgi:hypothetical protein